MSDARTNGVNRPPVGTPPDVPEQHERRLRPDLERRERLRLLGASLRQDARMARHHLVVNTLAGSALVPRALRYALLRAGGVATSTPNLFSGSRFHGSATVTLGAGTFVNRDCYFEANAPITIGADCHVGMRVTFVTSSHPVSEHGFAVQSVTAPVTIGDRCWIGAGATVLPGVTIGDDVVVAAGAVVTKDLPDPGVYGGVPARLIKPLRPAPPSSTIDLSDPVARPE